METNEYENTVEVPPQEMVTAHAPLTFQVHRGPITIRGNNFKSVSRFVSEIKKLSKDSLPNHRQALENLVSQANQKIKDVEVSVVYESQKLIVELDSKVEVHRFWGLPNANPYSVEREYYLKQLAEQAKNSKKNLITQCICGPGGIGKTELALDFAYLHRNQTTDISNTSAMKPNVHLGYDAILWFRGRTLDSDTRSLASLLSIDTTISKGLVLCKQLCELLSLLGPRVLLIFDDVEEEGDLADWVNAVLAHTHQGVRCTMFHLLVTSRNQNWNTWLMTVLDVFDEKQARDFVCKRLSRVTTEEANRLIELVHRFPLALAQSVAYIASHHKPVKDYCDLYRTSGDYQRSLLEKSSGHSWEAARIFFQDSRQRTAYNTWYLSIEALRKDCALAETVLNLCAFLDPDKIPVSLITQKTNGNSLLSLDPMHWDNVLKQLCKYSLVTVHHQDASTNVDVQSMTLSMHSLVQEVVRLHLRQQCLTDKMAQVHLNGLPTALTSTKEPNDKSATCYDLYGHYVLIRLSDLFKYNRVGACDLWHVGMLYTHCKQIANLAYDTEWDRPTTASLWQNLGDYLQEVIGDSKKSKAFLEKALRINRVYYRTDHHVAVARTLRSHTLTYGTLHDLRTRETILLKKVLPVMETCYGRHHVEVAHTLCCLATLYKADALGDGQTMKTLLERALPIKGKYYGFKNIEKIFSLAKTQRASGESQLINEILDALSIEEEHYGFKHMEVIRTLCDLAEAYGVLGDSRVMKAILKHALDIQQNFYDDESHMDIVSTRKKLASAYGQLGEHIAQKDELERILPVVVARHGQDSINVADVKSELAVACLRSGEHAKAKSLVEDARKNCINYPDHPNTQKVKDALNLIKQILPSDSIALTKEANEALTNRYEAKKYSFPSSSSDGGTWALVTAPECSQEAWMSGDKDVSKVMHDKPMRELLDKEAEFARSTSSKRIVGKFAIVKGHSTISQEGAPFGLELKSGVTTFCNMKPTNVAPTNAGDDTPNRVSQLTVEPVAVSVPRLTFSDAFLNSLDAAFDVQHCKFLLTRRAMILVIELSGTKETNPRQVNRILNSLQEELQVICNTANFAVAFNRTDDKSLTLTTSSAVMMDGLTRSLYFQAGGMPLNIISNTQFATFFSSYSNTKTSPTLAPTATITCPMQ